MLSEKNKIFEIDQYRTFYKTPSIIYARTIESY